MLGFYLLKASVSSIQFSRSVVSDSLWPHELKHTRPPCPSPTPVVHPNPCPLNQWCHPTISSSVVPFSSHPQSFPASGSFQMSQLSTSGDQSIGVSPSTSVPPMNTQDRSPLGWTGWISLQSKGFSRVFSNTTVQTHQFFSAQLSFFVLIFIFTLFYFSILYWFCHTLTWIHRGCTCVPKHEPPSHLPPNNVSLLHPALDIDWWFDSYMIVYMFQCHSPKSSHPLPLPLRPKVRYTHLCLFCCLSYRVIIAIFLNSIHMC